MRVLVTGATGFIGSHVAVALARAGHEVLSTGRDLQMLPALGAVPGIRLARLGVTERGGWENKAEA